MSPLCGSSTPNVFAQLAKPQALSKARIEFPASSSTYLPAQDVHLLAFYATNEPDPAAANATQRPASQCALTLAQFVEVVVKGGGAVPALADEAYSMSEEAAAAAAASGSSGPPHPFIFTSGGAIAARVDGGRQLAVRRRGVALKTASAAAPEAAGSPGSCARQQLIGTLPTGASIAVCCDEATAAAPAASQAQPMAPITTAATLPDAPSQPQVVGQQQLTVSVAAELQSLQQPEQQPEQPQELIQPDPQPALSRVHVFTPGGLMVELDTDGRVLLAPLQPNRLHARPMRGVRVHGAPVEDGDIGPLLPVGRGEWMAVLPGGHTLRKGGRGAGDMTLVLSDGSTSQRLETPPEEALEAAAARGVRLQGVTGWVRTGVDGARVWNADETAVEATLGAARARLATAEASSAALAAAAAAAAAAAESEPSPKKTPKQKQTLGKQSSKNAAAVMPEQPAPSPAELAAAAQLAVDEAADALRDLQAAAAVGPVVLPPLRTACVTDHDTGALVCTREDQMMAVRYGDGSCLVLVSFGACDCLSTSQAKYGYVVTADKQCAATTKTYQTTGWHGRPR